MKDETCKNCGGDHCIHHYKTMQCPVGGRECAVNRKQEWMDTTYEPDNQDLEERIAILEKQVKALLEAVPSAKVE